MKQSFTVQRKRRRPNADYTSGPNDARRQGRPMPDVASPPLAPSAELAFERRGNGVDATLGVVPVAHIIVNPGSHVHPFLWRCLLPMTLTTYQSAATLQKAQDAVGFRVREWLEAAGLVISAAALAKLRSERRWQ